MKNLICVGLLCICHLAVAQNPYWDAVFLSQYATNSGNKVTIDLTKIDSLKKIEIFSKYIQTGQTVEDQFNVITGNPLIAITGEQHTDQEGKIKGMASNALSAAGSLNVTNFADGLAKFLVERTKEELSISFFQKFEEELEKQKKLQLLFPITYINLKLLGEDIYMFSGYLETLREGFQRDIADMLENIKTLVNDKEMDEIFKSHPQIRIIFSDAIFLTEQLKAGQHIGDALNNYIISGEADSARLETINENLYPSLVTLNFLSQSIRNKASADTYYISFSQMKALDNDVVLKIYLGLLYQEIAMFQQSQHHLVIGGKPVLTLLEEASQGADKLMKFREKVKELISPIINEGAIVDQKYTTLENATSSGKDADAQEYYELINASVQIVETSALIYRSVSGEEDASKIQKYIDAFKKLGDLYADIREKRYSSAVTDFASLYQDMVINSLANDTLKAKHQKFLSQTVKYGTFAALVAKAENSDQVKDAIDAVALPVGSSRIKRESSFNVALNAYVGLYGGAENIEVNDSENYELAAGLSAPVGVALSWGIGGKKEGKGGKSISLFLSMIDIGSMASFRFNDDNTESVPQVQLKDIISPGVFGVFGFGKCPVSLGMGYQIGPRLHDINADAASVVSDTYGRFSAFIGVDIPMINFHTKSK